MARKPVPHKKQEVTCSPRQHPYPAGAPSSSPPLPRGRAAILAPAPAPLPRVHIRTGRAAGKLSVGFWDHWVPEGNAIMKKQCDAFAAAHQAEEQAAFIPSLAAQ